MRLSMKAKNEIKYTGIFSLLVLFSICVMVVQGLKINNMSLSDYRDVNNDNTTVIFSEK